MSRRYQLNKLAARVVEGGHPWIFRDQLSSAADVFAAGDLLELVDGSNAVLGYGVFEPEGLIAIRVLRRGTTPPDSEWLKNLLEKALLRRKNLRQYTNAFRALHGENDGLPGVVVDVYGTSTVLQTYAQSMDDWGKQAAESIAGMLGLKNLLWKQPAKRQSKEGVQGLEALMGTPLGIEQIQEGKLQYCVDLRSGQKSGLFLDLRHLRKWITLAPLKGKRVLNLFAYTGTLSLAAETAGAKEIWNVDISKGALEFGEKHHTLGKAHVKWISDDVFAWVKNLAPKEKFDLIIFDPPNMVAEKSQVKEALAMYRRHYAKLREHVNPGGMIAACCCTSRILRNEFKTCVENGLQTRLKFVTSLEPEDDHPVGFPQGDYLKVLLYRA